LIALPPLPPTITHLELGEGIDLSVLQEVLKSVSTNLMSLSIYITDLDLANMNSFQLPHLESLSVAIGPTEHLVSRWELPRLRYLTLRMHFLHTYFSSDHFKLGPFLEKHGAQLKFFHIHPETDCKCMSEFTVEIEGILKLCPSLERFVLHPRPIPPITHQRIKWFRAGNDIWDSQLPHTNSVHRIATAVFPSLKTLRKPPHFWTSWNACFRDLKSSFPRLVTKGIHQCLGVDVHEDVGEIFVYTDTLWTDEGDSGYQPSSASEDSDSESDWEVGSEKDHYQQDLDAQMDLLEGGI
jgi:hypothetical protein